MIALAIIVMVVLMLGGCALVDPGDLPMTQPLVILQDLTMVMALAVVLVEARWMLEVSRMGQRWCWLYGVGTILIFAHITVYYFVVLLFRAEVLHIPGQGEVILLTNWSAVIKAQFTAMVLIAEVLRLWDTLWTSHLIKTTNTAAEATHESS